MTLLCKSLLSILISFNILGMASIPFCLSSTLAALTLCDPYSLLSTLDSNLLHQSEEARTPRSLSILDPTIYPYFVLLSSF
ncbi:hypothetical protein EWM64_g4870 [Hericium alpestre]|uniref:Uncharacterized protein n=1 Tax=Hericium alpestre TaxID=135208 RepID=A0A4Y9ZWE5_9AGAM|nr:hypothetical protein EWM64_g4870 [Hericium alpestre]